MCCGSFNVYNKNQSGLNHSSGGKCNPDCSYTCVSVPDECTGVTVYLAPRVAFQEAGYTTAHFGKWHLNQVGPKDHPLPADDPHNPGELGFDYWLSATSGFDLPADRRKAGFRSD